MAPWIIPAYETILRKHQEEFQESDKDARSELVTRIRREIKDQAKTDKVVPPSGLRDVRTQIDFTDIPLLHC